MTLSGFTVYPPIENGDVEVRVGLNEYHGTTDETGRYLLEIEEGQSDDLVRIVVRGTGSEDFLHYARLVGSFEDLAVAANENQEVTIGAISPISTAFYSSLDLELSQNWPASFSEISGLTQLAPLANLQRRVFVLVMIGLQHVEIPDSASNTLELMRDAEAVFDIESDIMGQHWEQLSDVYPSLIQDQRLYKTKHAHLPLELTAILADFPDNRSFIMGSTRLDDSGLGAFAASAQAGTVQASLGSKLNVDSIIQDSFEVRTLDDYFLVLTGPGGTPIHVREGVTVSHGEEIPFRYATEFVGLGWLDASESIDLIRMIFQTKTIYPDDPERDPVVRKRAGLNPHVEYRESYLPAEWKGFTGHRQWLLPLCVYDIEHNGGPNWHGAFGFDIVNIYSDGTGYAARTDSALHWTLDGAVLTVSGDDIGSTELRFLGHDGKASVLLGTCRDANGDRKRIDILRAAAVSFDNTNHEFSGGRYISGMTLQPQIPRRVLWGGVVTPKMYWAMELNEDGSGGAGYLSNLDLQDVDFAYDVEWRQRDDGILEIQWYRDSKDSYGSGSRTWQIVEQHNGELIVLESVMQEPLEAVSELLDMPGRYNWWKLHDTLETSKEP